MKTDVRGPLPGAGKWTHQYANAANTACSDDTAVKAPFSILWFGNPGPKDMVNRHQRAAAPLSLDGRLFVEGENTLMAYDAYNGVKLWQRDIPGAVRLGVFYESGNMAVDPSGFYVGVRDHCLRLDPATGKTLQTYKLPPKDGSDGHLERQERALGLSLPMSTASSTARDRSTVAPPATFLPSIRRPVRSVWRYRGKEIPQSTLCIGGGKLLPSRQERRRRGEEDVSGQTGR